MTNRPVIFSASMVRSLIAGRKTQTRRLATSPLAKCQPEDRLWVREAWKPQHDPEIWMCVEYLADGARIKPIIPDDNDGGRFESMCDAVERGVKNPGRPSIHMPRWASRLTLVVTDVRRHPLQDITEADAIAEGAARLVHDGEETFYQSDTGSHRCGFAGLWDHLHGIGAWDANPEVVALTFTVHRSNIDATPAHVSIK